MEYSTLNAAELRPYHKNARLSDVGKIAASLRQNGQYKPIVVNRGTLTGREWEVLAGNHVLEAAKALEWTTIETVIVDVDDKKAAQIVLADNKTSDSSTYDMAALDELLQELVDDVDDLEGTGYSEIDYVEALDRHDRATASALDGTDDDDAPPPVTGGLGSPVVSYTLVFDDAAQQNRWYAYLKWLRQGGAPGETIAERILADVAAHAPLEDVQ